MEYEIKFKRYRSYFFSFALIISLVLIFSTNISDVSAASSSVVYVSANNGNNDWDGFSATYNATSKSGPKATILNATGTVDNGGTVRIANGNYSGTGNENLEISKNMTIIGQSRANTQINGNFIKDIDSNCYLKLFNLTVTGGASNEGGAITNHGTLNLDGVTFSKNTANTNGGAILNNGNLNINNCRFYENFCSLMGGAIYNTGTLNVTNTSFERNNASAIANYGTATVMGSDFSSNFGNGGAAYNSGILTVKYSRIVNNEFGGPTFFNDKSTFSGATLDASANWWGSNDDPSYYVYDTTINSWIIAKLYTTSALIPKNGHTLVKLDLVHNNLGNLVTGIVPDGIPVNFYSTLGNITGTAYTVNGIATATLSGGTVGGIATVSAMVDKASVGSTVTIDVTQPVASANIKSGVYNTTKVVTITMNKKGTIYYTLNGTTPTTTSSKYTGPLSIGSSKVLKFFAVDLAGNKSQIYSYNYTIDKTAPKVVQTTPGNLKTNVSRSAVIYLKFSETVGSSLNYNNIQIKSSTGKILTLYKSLKGNTLTIRTSSKTAKTWYTVTIPKSAIKDVAGNKLASNYVFKFKTGS